MNYQYLRSENEKNLSAKMNEYLSSFFSWNYPESKCNLILLLTVMCGFISKEEIVDYTGMTYVNCERQFHLLLKDGYIKQIPLKGVSKKHISRTDTLFTYTKKGYDYATQNIPGGENVYNPYKYKKENVKNPHDYINGMNLLECILGLKGEEFTWFRERVYGNRSNSKGTLAVDSIIGLPNFHLHIEQDLGNETAAVLLEKLFLYQKYPDSDHPILSSDKDAVLISYYKPMYLKEPAYQQVLISSLASEVSDTDQKNRLECAFKDKTISPKALNALQSLYAETEKINGQHAFLKVSDLMKMNVKYGAENPFYKNSYRKKQYDSFIKKKNYLAMALWYTNIYYDIRRDIYDGFPIYMVPTVFLERYVRYICKFQEYYDNLTKCLEPYFGKLDFNNYSPRGKIENTLYLRNHFSSKNGHIYVEYPTIDLGAIMRIRNFLEHSNNLSSVNHLIVVVDQVSEVIDIAKKVKDFTRGRQQGIVHIEEPDQEITYFFSKKDYNDIYYICRNDLDKGTAEKLISMTGYNEYENDDGIMVGVGKAKIFSLISEKNPQLDIPF